MFFAIVAVELERLAEGLVARLVAARLESFPYMTILMLDQSLTITKSLVATLVGASKRAFFCMHERMGLQIFPPSECPVARIVHTSQGALLVCAVMLSQ